VQEQEQAHEGHRKNVPGEVAGCGSAHADCAGTFSELRAAPNDDRDLPEAASGDGEVCGLQPFAGGCGVRCVEHERAAAGGSEDQRDVGVLDEARLACAFDGDAEIRMPSSERVGCGEERDNEGAAGLAEAKATSVSAGSLDARADQKSEKDGSELRAHHMPIPRMYIGWVKIQMATA
jgi:hypothetical protein